MRQHRYKEEMRQFPMLEQRANALLGRPVDDLHGDGSGQIAATMLG
jgi:iron-sulfur cluster repair protein YtfE (RIC family)